MKLLHTFSLFIVSASFSLYAAGQPNPPTWPENVRVYPDNGANTAAIQFDADAAKGAALANGTGYALLFKPGEYSGLDIIMAQFGSIMGLGLSPGITDIDDVRALQSNNMDPCIGSLNDHWKSAENFTTTPTITPPGYPSTFQGMSWEVSQGCPMRSVVINGNLILSGKTTVLNTDKTDYIDGACTGAFLANCTVIPNDMLPKPKNLIFGGAQRQAFLRNVAFGSGSTEAGYGGGKWNQIFVGCGDIISFVRNRISTTTYLTQKCGNCPTTIEGNELTPVCLCTNSLCSPTPPERSPVIQRIKAHAIWLKTKIRAQTLL